MILRVVLGDQLNLRVSSLTDIDPANDLILMCEVWEEATYLKHHKKKIAFLFSAMRHFAQELMEQGFTVHYTTLNDRENAGSFCGEIERAIKIYQPEKVVITEPSEYRVLTSVLNWNLDVPIEVRNDDRFLISHQEFGVWAQGKKQLRMEYFYREVRKKYAILLDGNGPEGGSWNYDSENRKPPKQGLRIPPHDCFETDRITKEVIELVASNFSHHFGDLMPFTFAVTREQALQVLRQFIKERLPYFGQYQDAMLQDEPWMYHSHISFYINCGLLLPLECVQAAEKAYRLDLAPLNAVEGFIRQIIGWREFVRGIYWRHMPDYERWNFLEAKRKLPALFWGAETRMNCLQQCVKETKENAYAHHIQRLMVLGNFALLTGLNPDEVNDWYMIVYADAFQWVELPNVTGMVLFADGGLLGSKPYAASGAYINRMSNYCQHCQYKVTKKNGTDACPFNYLYWYFLHLSRDKLSTNPRLGMMYKALNKMTSEKIIEIEDDSERFLTALDNSEPV